VLNLTLASFPQYKLRLLLALSWPKKQVNQNLRVKDRMKEADGCRLHVWKG
jgi:hypothetical protein